MPLSIKRQKQLGIILAIAGTGLVFYFLGENRGFQRGQMDAFQIADAFTFQGTKQRADQAYLSLVASSEFEHQIDTRLDDILHYLHAVDQNETQSRADSRVIKQPRSEFHDQMEQFVRSAEDDEQLVRN